jgi:predicted O-methyltransferase YrrM
MRQLLRTVLPVPVSNAARDMRDRLWMRTEPKQTLDPTSLRVAAGLPLDALFADSTTAAAWREDHAAIEALFGDRGWPGSDNPGDCRALYHIVRHLRPQGVLEVGTYVGGSTLYIARALKRLGAGRLTTVDVLDVNGAAGPWKDVGLSMPPMELARRLDCADVIDFTTEASLDFMGRTAERFDLVYLDGDMAARSVYRNVAAALRVLARNGIILLHAYYPNATPLFPDQIVLSGPFYAMARIARENPGVRALPLGNLPWPTKQGSHATTLALVVRSS